MASVELTDRQAQIAERLAAHMSARDIAEELDITRNAVYQQIQALRRKGALDPEFTPSGAPPRGDTARFTSGAPDLTGFVARIRDDVARIEDACASLRTVIGG